MASGIGLAGGVMSGISDFAAGRTRSELFGTNADIADMQARSEMSVGSYNANLARLKGARTVGAQTAAIGANNLQQGGTNQLIVADTARAAEADALMTQNNALRRAWGFEVQGASDRFQAGEAERGGILSGIGAFVGAGGRFASQLTRKQTAAMGTDYYEDEGP